MLDEKGLRRPNFDEANSVWITLADSQKWAFPKPWLQIHASFKDGRAADTHPVLTYGPEIEDLVKAISECDDNAAILMGAASLGAYLLTSQYTLSDADLDQLFAFRIGDPGSSEWVKAVMDVATGATGSRSFKRWQRLTLMASSTLPRFVLLEDANDLVDFIEATGRTIPRSKWAVESMQAAAAASNDAMF